MNEKYKNYILNLMFPAIIFGSVTGAFSAAVIAVYKLCAKYVITFSENGYHFLKDNLFYIPIVLAFLLLFAFLLSYIYKKVPNIRGGGIPTSIGILRGIISFSWIKNLIGILQIIYHAFVFYFVYKNILYSVYTFQIYS